VRIGQCRAPDASVPHATRTYHRPIGMSPPNPVWIEARARDHTRPAARHAQRGAQRTLRAYTRPHLQNFERAVFACPRAARVSDHDGPARVRFTKRRPVRETMLQLREIVFVRAAMGRVARDRERRLLTFSLARSCSAR